MQWPQEACRAPLLMQCVGHTAFVSTGSSLSHWPRGQLPRPGGFVSMTAAQLGMSWSASLGPCIEGHIWHSSALFTVMVITASPVKLHDASEAEMRELKGSEMPGPRACHHQVPPCSKAPPSGGATGLQLSNSLYHLFVLHTSCSRQCPLLSVSVTCHLLISSLPVKQDFACDEKSCIFMPLCQTLFDVLAP